ncbi:transcription termination factor MTERF8, chloroplastic-like [Vicia villosa]|uniref:transcription termination factor MTERF8, chloroplastic-like n=1 Tax=Vicia villosa TaxID=3911 RepID=UPI00273BC1F9|nr:transcription termination factor MTERF8, chloroplastic-like [Vicia villosa]XP_058786689.1 transcription termination factor MTERF8, chloroplastic-like [Vicia villosa]
MALAALPLFSNPPCHCSSSITTFLPSHSRHLTTQPFISPLTKSQPPNSNYFLSQSRLSTHCRCTSHTPNLDFQYVRLVTLFQEIGISFEETNLLLSNASELTSIQLDLLRDRILSLKSLGLGRMSINHIVTEQLNVLTSNEIDPLLSFLRNELQGQVEEAKVKLLLLANEPKELSDFPHKVQLLIDSGIGVDKIAHVLNKVSLSKAICHRSMEEIERVISFLKPFGGVDLIVKNPAILNYDLDNQLKPRIRVLTELSGGDDDSVGKVLNRFPIILNYTVEHVEEHIEFLKSFAELDDQQIFTIVLVFPAIFTNSRETKLRPRIQFLKDCGLDSGDIFKFLFRAPVFLSISFRKNLASKLLFLVKIGYEYRTKELAMAIAASTRTSCGNMQKVVSLFLNSGLSSEEIFAMSKKHPPILWYNHASLEKKIKYLTEEMDRDIKELLDFPAFLGYKLDDRIKHRYEIKKDLWEGQISLNQLLTVSSKNFK